MIEMNEKTLKQSDADETIRRIKNKLYITKDIRYNDLIDINLLSFMNSDKEPIELLKIAVDLIKQVNMENSIGITEDNIEEVKDILLLFAHKITESEEEYEEIESRLRMNGGILQGTVDQLKRIGREEGIEIGVEIERIRNHREKIEIAQKLLKKEMSVEEISEVTKLDKEEIKNLK